jgi:hypothetical protein
MIYWPPVWEQCFAGSRRTHKKIAKREDRRLRGLVLRKLGDHHRWMAGGGESGPSVPWDWQWSARHGYQRTEPHRAHFGKLAFRCCAEVGPGLWCGARVFGDDPAVCGTCGERYERL